MVLYWMFCSFCLFFSFSSFNMIKCSIYSRKFSKYISCTSKIFINTGGWLFVATLCVRHINYKLYQKQPSIISLHFKWTKNNTHCRLSKNNGLRIVNSMTNIINGKEENTCFFSPKRFYLEYLTYLTNFIFSLWTKNQHYFETKLSSRVSKTLMNFLHSFAIVVIV